MSQKVLVPIAEGIEELEAVTIIDIFRRAGAEVTVASVNRLQVTASRGVKLVADVLIGDCREQRYDLIALPGGMPGAEHLRDCKELEQMLRDQQQHGRLLAAICASPAVVFAHHGLIDKCKATCYPSLIEQLPNPDKTGSTVVVDGTCVTSQGPGTAAAFALKLIELLFSSEKAHQIARQMLLS